MYYFLASFLYITSLFSLSNEEIFTKVYEENLWGVHDGGEVTSGPGSTLVATEPYRQFLQAFLKEHEITSVVEAGFGDWYSSRLINWEGIEYKGFDVVPHLIESCNAKYASENISFHYADIIHDDLPAADLLLCKDVLQHLNNEAVSQFLTQLPKYKYCLLTTDFMKQKNTHVKDIPMGYYRVIDIRKAPFNMPAEIIFHYFLTKKNSKKRFPGISKVVYLVRGSQSTGE